MSPYYPETNQWSLEINSKPYLLTLFKLNYLCYLFQIFGLKIIEEDDYILTSNDLLEYAEEFKIILENKNKMNSSVYRFIVTRLIDNLLLASMLLDHIL